MRFVALLVLCFVLFLPGLNAQVNGQLQTIDGKLVLHVWGDHYERGYAQGYMFSNRILTLFNDYFYASVCGNNPMVYNYLLSYYNNCFTVEPKFVLEITGMLEGIAASGQSLYHSGLQRNLGISDLLMINAIVDLNPVRSEYLGRNEHELGCSSISSWGAATTNDPHLSGNLIFTRFMDWANHPALIANPALIVHHPSDPLEQKWASFFYPGMIGALSGISDSRSAAFLNMGNTHGGDNFTNLRHVLFSIREALETYDFNGDGQHNLGDFNAALSTYRFRAGTIIHTMLDDDAGIEPAVFECNNFGSVMRTQSQNGSLPQDHIAATNHFRLLFEPVYCYRYTNIFNALTANPHMSLNSQWQMLSAAAGVPANLMAIQYIPSLEQISWSTASSISPAYQNPPMTLSTSSLFAFNPTQISDPLIPVVSKMSFYPNPLKKGQSLRIKSAQTLSAICIYNLRGQKLAQRDINPENHELFLDNELKCSGIYLIKAIDIHGRTTTAKLLWMN
ncbi:MAG: T9SS type A sorting domain-containing protein [Candidatus Cloacimonadaceae bacterium]|nr:T9SS type A sorting domain-containing protein [Candidatus Cloacimonadaceae bacterium]